jgi:hypothetical protein
MEKHITGYTCVVDEKKSEEQRQFERWSKLITPESTYSEKDGEPKIYKASLDAYLFIDVPSNEAIRRSQNRKIDPQTGMIYHMEDNPPPENDAKLRDRLQEYMDPEDENGRINNNFSMYESSNSSLKKWISGFGLYDHDFSHIPPVSSLL